MIVISLGILLALGNCPAANAVTEEDRQDLPDRFARQEPEGGSISLYWLNGELNGETLKQQIELLRQNGFAGIAPLPMRSTRPEYLSRAYFELYRSMLDELAARGMELMFYDDCDFPTGTAGGRMKEVHPDKLIKYLTRVDTTLRGGETRVIDIPDGQGMRFCQLMSACISGTGETGRTSISDNVNVRPAADGFVAQVELPAGEWRLQLFLCCSDKNARLVDYLDPDAVGKLMELTYGAYYRLFPEHFGTTIRTTFYDDHAYYQAPGAAEWTDGFNEKFKESYGFPPDTLYPSLFENTGGGDAAGRVAMYGVRDRMNAEGYPRVVSQWAAAHRMACSGHPAGTYRPNPLQLMGDGLLYFKHQDIPLCDYIHFLRQGIDGFNIPASAAYNYDRDILYCEIYGNFQPDSCNDGDMLYRAAMDVYARGINKLIPHGTWYDDAQVAIAPEISWRNPRMATRLKDYNRWVSRCEMILQHSRHVAQVGILYPIADMQSHYHFGEYAITNGRESIRGNRYFDLIGTMTRKLRVDYTLIHPETLDERCVVGEDGVLRLDNPKNYEEYRLLIVPWCRTIHVSNLAKVKDCADRGVNVLFMGHYPEKSAEFAGDEAVQRLVDELKHHPGVHFMDDLDEEKLEEFIRGHIDLNVRVEQVRETGGTSTAPAGRPAAFRDRECAFNVIHKVRDGMDFFFFGNPTDDGLTAEISFADGFGKGKRVELWNPHTGKIEKLHPVQTQDGRLRITLPLEPVQSRFITVR
jgi:hypothetical protein